MFRNIQRRLFIIFMIMSVVISTAIPGMSEEPEPIGYGKTNIKGINVRAKPFGKADVVEKIPITGTVVLILGKEEDAQQVEWYAVRIKDTDGFIRADLLDEITREEYAQALAEAEASKQKKRTSQPTLAGSKIPNNTGASSSGHSGYPDSTSVWVANGVFHSDLACPNIADGNKTTLGSARQQGLKACSLCWCYECLYGE